MHGVDAWCARNYPCRQLICEGLDYSMPRTVLDILAARAFIAGSRALLGDEGEVD